jgi:hypothetical protein
MDVRYVPTGTLSTKTISKNNKKEQVTYNNTTIQQYKKGNN